MAAYLQTEKNYGALSSGESFKSPPLGVGDRVVWLGKEVPEPGTVRWIGVLPSVCKDGWAAGIELDNPEGDLDGHLGGQELFKCPAYHGIFIDVKGLIKEKDFLGNDLHDSDRVSSLKKKTSGSSPSTILSATGSVASTSRTSDVDDVLGGIITTHSTPASCMGSFDRRVYARMFAECEVEKWYEALNYVPPVGMNGCANTDTLSESKNERELYNNTFSPKLKKTNTIDNGQLELRAPKKERGGIFKFFRWISGRSSSRKARSKHRRDYQVSELRCGRTKSLDSVTSLSQSFHYIPVGGLCSERDVSQMYDDSKSVDVDLNSFVSNNNNDKKFPKHKSGSLSRLMTDEREKGKRQRSAGTSINSRSSVYSSAENSPSSSRNSSKKKRKAPLPPSGGSRQHWVKVLPPSSQNGDAKRSSSQFQQSLNNELAKLKPSKSAHNKRQAPAPPPNTLVEVPMKSETFVEPDPKFPETDKITNSTASKMNEETPGPSHTSSKTRAIVENGKEDNIIVNNSLNPIAELVESDGTENDAILEDSLLSGKDTNALMEVEQTPENDLRAEIKNELKTGVKNDLEGSKHEMETLEVQVTDETQSVDPKSSEIGEKTAETGTVEVELVADEKETLNDLSADSETAKDGKSKLTSKLGTQMNIQALQDLVESLVLQYCETNIKFDEVKATERGVQAAGECSSRHHNVNGEQEQEKSDSQEDETSTYENVLSCKKKEDEKVEEEDLASQLMERWQLRMREELTNLHADLLNGKEPKPKFDETDSTERRSDTYEPIGNYTRKHHHRRQSLEEVSRSKNSSSNHKPPTGRRRMSSTSNATDEESEKTLKDGAATVELEEEAEDGSADPFLFWRGMDAKENNTHQKNSKLIRRLSVNGQRQLMSAQESQIKHQNNMAEHVPLMYSNYSYSSVYRHPNWLPKPSPQVNAHSYNYPNFHHHYSPYFPPNYYPLIPNYDRTALEAQLGVEPHLSNTNCRSYDNLQKNELMFVDSRKCYVNGSSKMSKMPKQSEKCLGKRIYANDELVDVSVAVVAPPPPPPPPPRAISSCCSSRLAANCYWLKKSGKTVEEKVQAARDDLSSSPPPSKNGSGNNIPASPSVGRSRKWPLATLENSVVIGGVRVKTPLNLWPLEYELIVPELRRLKARLEGRPLPEDENVSEANCDVETMAINKLLNELELAICNGSLDEAAARARDLAQLKIQCSVTRHRREPTKNGDDVTLHNNNLIIVNMFVEDKTSHFGPIPIKVVPSMTIGQLKLKMFKEFQFPVHVQRWILGQRLASDDNVALSNFGVISDGFPVYLYLLIVGIDELMESRKDNRSLDKIESPKVGSKSRDKTKSGTKTKKEKRSNIVRTRATGSSESFYTNQQKGDVNLGWACEKCTLFNAAIEISCVMCGNARPPDYLVPNTYPASAKKIGADEKQEENKEQISPEEEERRRLNNWQQYLNLDDQDVIHNVDSFECGICLVEVAAGAGVQLRECLHLFCAECLRNVVSHTEEASVRCPYRDDEYSCDCILQEREIRALVPPDVFERYLRRSIVTAESQAPNSFHCKTPDCPGWCLYADNANEFLCPNCGKLNCITCRVIHEGLNCKQYQDELSVKARTDDDAKKTKEAIEEMVRKGDAMKCPSCDVVVMKKWGCDWIVCSICKFEICWVTKGPRWGPKGRGDSSGGCKCGINGVRCHPKCNYCH